jgi:hypothetical protein
LKEGLGKASFISKRTWLMGELREKIGEEEEEKNKKRHEE